MKKNSGTYSSPMTLAYKAPTAPRGGVALSGKLEAQVSDHGVYRPSKRGTAPDKTPLTDTFRTKKG